MTNKNLYENLCLSCSCYDEDLGCTMPSIDRTYACPINQHKKMQFFMAMIPPTVTAQMHKVTVQNGRPVFYDPPEIKDARSKLMSYLSQYKPEVPFTVGVRLTVKWLFPKGRHKDGEYRITKPDTDNLQKLLKDCMTLTGFWNDDALVVSEIIEKFWADIPGIWIRIEEL